LRNAIENSDRGVIRIATSDDGKVTIADPGHGMPDEEMRAVYTRLARSGEAVGATGIGLELISRLCEHLGWRLAFSSERDRGTTATLDFGSCLAAKAARPTSRPRRVATAPLKSDSSRRP
jgi:signal transduction histidine kinase